MSRLDLLRLFVDQRLSSVTDDIFRRFARTIAEYEREVSGLKREIRRQAGLLEAAGRRAADTPAGGAGVTTEEEQLRGRGFSPLIKQEEGGALGAEVTDTNFKQSHVWLTKRPDSDQSPSSKQIQWSRPAANKEEVVSIKQEVDEGYLMLETAVRAEISSQQEGVLQIFTREEDPRVRGRGFNLYIKQEDSRASGLEETVTTQVSDWLMETYEDGSLSSSHVHPHSEEDLIPTRSDPLRKHGGACIPTDHNIIQSESFTEDSDDAQLEPGFQSSGGPGTRPPVDQKLLVCGSCGREFSSKRTLRKHIRQNTSQDQEQMLCSLRRQRAPFQSPVKSFSCRICGSSFSTQGILVRHAENHCKEPESRCGACGDCLESTEFLRDHLRSHKELGSTCDVCGKKCSSIKRMEIHKRVHTGEKPYRCGFCSRDFSRKESLERHLKVHSGDRPHGCGLCRRTFTRREYLIHHLRTGHMERPGPPAAAEPFSMTL